MAEEKKKKEEEKGFEIDFGIGKLSFGGLFKGIGNLIEMAAELGKEIGEIKKVGEIKGLPKGAKGIFGFTVRTLAGERAEVVPFGNIRETPKGPVVEEVREPIVDVFDEKDHILVVAELPGIEEADIKTEIKDDILNISAEKGERKYKKEVLLPSKVEVEPISSTYKNGILEIKLTKLGK
ncbi:MAG: Hsp20/alpha crystallin family protein [Candidatus Edwardsbacteria bacterium]